MPAGRSRLSGRGVTLTAVLLGALTLAGCTGTDRAAHASSRPETTSATSPSSTTSSLSTGSTTAPRPAAPTGRRASPPGPVAFAGLPSPPGAGPLTGFAGSPGPSRPALVVKIDNTPPARPQSGINEADLVFEEQVEGGMTRLAAVFDSQDADRVGPVRSARSTDIGVVGALGRPLFAYSGANNVFKAELKQAPLIDVGVDNFPGRYHRDPSRPEPENLFSSTASLAALAPSDDSAPPPLFTYRDPDTPPSGAGAVPVGHLHVDWPNRSATVDYDWDGSAGLWRRTQSGRPHLDTAGRQVAPANVVVQFVTYRNTGLVDRAHNPVPEAQVVGEGDAWILTGGVLIPAHWSKPSPDSVTRFVDGAGMDVPLSPGRTWIELVPPGRAAFVQRPPDPPPAPAAPSSTTSTTTPPSEANSNSPSPEPQPVPTPPSTTQAGPAVVPAPPAPGSG
jgi:Protein of unknown function (DUF3048) N-terminal domain/Protein of unknown function (DUF3048) C-terminal domain